MKDPSHHAISPSGTHRPNPRLSNTEVDFYISLFFVSLLTSTSGLHPFFTRGLYSDRDYPTLSAILTAICYISPESIMLAGYLLHLFYRGAVESV